MSPARIASVNALTALGSCARVIDNREPGGLEGWSIRALWASPVCWDRSALRASFASRDSYAFLASLLHTTARIVR